MTALDRIRRIKTAWDFFGLSLEVTDYVLRGQIRRSLRGRRRVDQRLQNKQPATTRIKVESERGPIQ